MSALLYNLVKLEEDRTCEEAVRNLGAYVGCSHGARGGCEAESFGVLAVIKRYTRCFV